MEMKEKTTPALPEQPELQFDLGTFEGFNFHTQSPICRNLTAADVIGWQHDLKGEAEFWPAGDRPEVKLLFSGNVTGSELSDLARLLAEIGNDSLETFLRIHYAKNIYGLEFEKLTAREIEDLNVHLFFGDCFTDARKEAAYELFQLYWPEEYRVWEKSLCDGLIFDTDRFLDSPVFGVDEVRFGETIALIVAPQ
jgi:hypothetical protein